MKYGNSVAENGLIKEQNIFVLNAVKNDIRNT